MKIQFFVCFHKKIFHEVYFITPEEKEKYLTFYGVKEKDLSENKNIIYEYELKNYNPMLQKKKYNEGSCIYHVYANNLHSNYDYVGFCQYDMFFDVNTFKDIETKIYCNTCEDALVNTCEDALVNMCEDALVNTCEDALVNTCEDALVNKKTIFYLDFFKWAFLGGQTCIIQDYYNIPAGLNNYNNFFNTNYTINDLLNNKMIICNTFLIPKKMYEKMMSWLNPYFTDDINIRNFCNKGYDFNPGHMIEALTSMFLALEINEGASYEKLNLLHDHQIKNKLSFE